MKGKQARLRQTVKATNSIEHPDRPTYSPGPVSASPTPVTSNHRSGYWTAHGALTFINAPYLPQPRPLRAAGFYTEYMKNILITVKVRKLAV